MGHNRGAMCLTATTGAPRVIEHGTSAEQRDAFIALVCSAWAWQPDSASGNCVPVPWNWDVDPVNGAA